MVDRMSSVHVSYLFDLPHINWCGDPDDNLDVRVLIFDLSFSAYLVVWYGT